MRIRPEKQFSESGMKTQDSHDLNSNQENSNEAIRDGRRDSERELKLALGKLQDKHESFLERKIPPNEPISLFHMYMDTAKRSVTQSCTLISDSSGSLNHSRSVTEKQPYNHAIMRAISTQETVLKQEDKGEYMNNGHFKIWPQMSLLSLHSLDASSSVCLSNVGADSTSLLNERSLSASTNPTFDRHMTKIPFNRLSSSPIMVSEPQLTEDYHNRQKSLPSSTQTSASPVNFQGIAGSFDVLNDNIVKKPTVLKHRDNQEDVLSLKRSSEPTNTFSLGFLIIKSVLLNHIKASISEEWIVELQILSVEELDYTLDAPCGLTCSGTTYLKQSDLPKFEHSNGKLTVVSGNIMSLIELLLSKESVADHDFLHDFLKTFRYFSCSYDIFRILLVRYIECTMTTDESCLFVQLRILNFFKKWAQEFPRDFSSFALILKKFLEYVKLDSKKVPHADYILEKIQQTPNMVKSTDDSVGSDLISVSHSRKASFDSKSETKRRLSAMSHGISNSLKRDRQKSHPEFDIFTLKKSQNSLVNPQDIYNLDPNIVAQQITLLEQEMFQKIEISEFFGQQWNKHSGQSQSPNLTRFIRWFNHVAEATATQVVQEQNLSKRSSILKRMIYIAHLCLANGNYNTCFEIVAGLNLGPVSRLHKTWKILPKKYLEVWNFLNQVVSTEGSYRAYRSSLQSLKENVGDTPLIPYLGVTLSDLTFTEDGNKTFIKEPQDPSIVSTADETVKHFVFCNGSTVIKPAIPPNINFVKFRLISKILNGIIAFQTAPKYTFNRNQGIQSWLQTRFVPISDIEMYRLSRMTEPRNAPVSSDKIY